MKKLSLLLCLALSSALLIAGCGKDKDSEKVENTVVETPVVVPEADASADETPAEEAPQDLPPQEGMVRSPLTNEWVTEDVAALRPIAVMIPNDENAYPHYNLSNADILYECMVEGKYTRMMGVFSDWTNLEKIGNLRSCRDYYVYWAFEWDAIYVHCGGPELYVTDVLSRPDTQNINEAVSPKGVFFRTSDRKAPHNLYFNGSDLLAEVQRKNYPLEVRSDRDNTPHFQFSTESAPNTLDQYSDSVSAKKISLADAYPITKTWFEYNEEDGLYYRFQNHTGGAHVDAVTGEQLSFKNILIQFTYHEVRDAKGYLAFQCIDDTRDGFFFTNGKGIHVTWEKSSNYDATRYYDENGNEITLNTGKTMICIVPVGKTFSYEN